MVTGTLIHGVHAVQVQGQAPPEAMHLSRLQGHQVSVPGQPPEILAWVRKGKVATTACCGYRDPFLPFLPFHGTPWVTFEEESFTTNLGHSIKVGSAPVRHILLGPAGQNVRQAERENIQPKQLGEVSPARIMGVSIPEEPTTILCPQGSQCLPGKQDQLELRPKKLLCESSLGYTRLAQNSKVNSPKPETPDNNINTPKQTNNRDSKTKAKNVRLTQVCGHTMPINPLPWRLRQGHHEVLPA